MFDRRDLIAKGLAFGVISCTGVLSPEAIAEAWIGAEAPRRPTPEVELGPFYKRLAPETNMLRKPGDPGLPLDVSGIVYDTRGDILHNAVIEIWQADHHGIYDNDGYDYRAKLLSDAAGKYSYSSVMPGHYPARVCQHVHYLVRAEGHKPLITQMYFATDPVLQGDPDKNFSKDPLITSRELVRPVMLSEVGDGLKAAVLFELVLERL